MPFAFHLDHRNRHTTRVLSTPDIAAIEFSRRTASFASTSRARAGWTATPCAPDRGTWGPPDGWVDIPQNSPLIGNHSGDVPFPGTWQALRQRMGRANDSSSLWLKERTTWHMNCCSAKPRAPTRPPRSTPTLLSTDLVDKPVGSYPPEVRWIRPYCCSWTHQTRSEAAESESPNQRRSARETAAK